MAVGDFGTAIATAIKGRVKTINNTAPDAGGNVNVSAAFTPSGYDIILLAGQSNMAGWSTTGTSEFTDPTHPLIDQVDCYGSNGDLGVIKPATRTMDFRSGVAGISPGLTFARWYIATGLNAGRKVLLVPAAANNTALVELNAGAWNPNYVGTNLYTQSIDRVEDGLAVAGSQLVAILWVQGESDAVDGRTGAEYEAVLDDLIAGYRAAIPGASQVPFIIGQMVPDYLNAPRLEIDAVQAATPGRVAWTGYAPGPFGLVQGDGNHYSAAGHRELGRRMFEAYQRTMVGLGAVNPAYRPVVTQATAPTDRSAVWVDTSGVAEPVKVWNGTAWVAASAGIPVPDTTAPTRGTMAASSITTSGFTLTVSGASDAGGLHAQPYAFTTDGGTTWSAYQTSPIYTASGLTGGTGYSCNWRVRDAALNVSTGTAQTVTTTATDSVNPTWTATFTMGTPTETAVVATASALATDNVAVTGYEVSYNDGSTYAAITPSGSDFTLTGSAGTTYTTTKLRAKDAAGNASTALSVPSYTMAENTDNTPPTWSATLTPGTPTDTSVVVTASALATDNVAVTGYEVDVAGTGTWAAITPSGSDFTLSGLTASTTYADAELRAKDAANNYSTPLAIPSFTTAAAWSPANLPNLALWLDASTITATEADPIATWSDASGLGNHATQSTAELRPTYTTANGIAALKFTGTEHLTTVRTHTDEYTQIAVVRLDSTSPTSTQSVCGSQANTHMGLTLYNGRSVAMGTTPLGGTIDVSAWKAIGGTFSNSADQRTGWQGLATPGTGSTTLVPPTTGGGIIGAEWTGYYKFKLKGELAEVIWCESVLSETDREKVMQYLLDKYSLS